MGSLSFSSFSSLFSFASCSEVDEVEVLVVVVVAIVVVGWEGAVVGRVVVWEGVVVGILVIATDVVGWELEEERGWEEEKGIIGLEIVWGSCEEGRGGRKRSKVSCRVEEEVG